MKELDKHLSRIQLKLSQGKTTIGIDVGTSSVNVAQMAPYKGKATLIKTAIVPIESRADGHEEQATLSALKQALSQFDVKKAKYACVVNCAQTSIRKIIIPYMPKEEMKSAVSLEVKRSLPFSVDDAVLDFSIIEEVMDKGVGKLSVIVAASPKETIERILGYFIAKKSKPFAGSISKKFEDQKKVDPLGLKISALLPMSLCLENIIEQSNLNVKETLVTLEMGTFFTELNIYKDARLQFSRKLPFSGNAITKALTETLMTEQGKVELTVDEAETIKREYGIPSIEDNKTIDGKITTNHILSLVRPKVEQLANEIERSFDFYREQMHGKKLDRVVLFGGGAQLKGLADFLSKELSLEVSSANPLEDIELLSEDVVASDEDAHKLILAIGAALSSLKGINLLPVQLKEKRRRTIREVSLISTLSIFILGILLLFGTIKYQSHKVENEYALTKSEFDQMIPELQKAKLVAQIRELGKSALRWDDALKDISQSIPKNMYISSMQMDGNLFKLKGSVVQGGGASEKIISQFMIELEKSMFHRVQLVNTKRNSENEEMLSFEIKCEVQ